VTQDLHLAQAQMRMHDAERDRRVAVRFRLDSRHLVSVPAQAHRSFERRIAQRHGRQALPQAQARRASVPQQGACQNRRGTGRPQHAAATCEQAVGSALFTNPGAESAFH
jgi:hypothetical protein